MIRSDFDYTLPFNQAILLLTGALLLLQCAVVWKHRLTRRFTVRLALNLLLWAAIMAFIWKPYILLERSAATAVVIADNVPSAFVRPVMDSLGGAKVLQLEKLQKSGPDTLVIIGQDFPDGFSSQIKQLKKTPLLRWIPYFPAGRLQALQWKGVVRKGEMQVISGTVSLSRKQFLKIRFGKQTLDSIALDSGLNYFNLRFPAFAQGRTAAELVLGDETLDTIRFFTRPEQKLTVRFLLNNPDFESRNLANWLGKKGHSVLFEATLSKNISTNLNFNKARGADLLITVPANASSAVTKRALSDGKSVLFMGLYDVTRDLATINAASGTNFQVKRISNDEQVALTPALNALPFQFVQKALQQKAPHYPVMAEKSDGQVAVTLLNETFPAQLVGDSLSYQKIWNEILALARPVADSNAAWTAPSLEGHRQEMRWNNFAKLPTRVLIGKDTVFTTPSALNSASVTAYFRPLESGWVGVSEPAGAEMFVYDNSGLGNILSMEELTESARTGHMSARVTADHPGKTPARLPDWAWFGILIVVFAAVWIEQKL